MSPHPVRIAALTLALALSPPSVAEEVRYISDELLVPLRATPCGNCAILHRGLAAGTRLTVLGFESGWANVTTSQGLNGWLPEQYLVEKPIARDRLNAAEASTRALSEENAELKNRLTALEETASQLESDNSELQTRNADLESELLAIRRVSGNALTLQEQNEELIKQNRILQSEIDVLTATRDQLANNQSQRWFLYGGVTVFLGALLAILLPKLRPRKRYSEWG